MLLIVIEMACWLQPAGAINQKMLRMTPYVMLPCFTQQMPHSHVREVRCLPYVLEEEMTLHSWAAFQILSSVTLPPTVQVASMRRIALITVKPSLINNKTFIIIMLLAPMFLEFGEGDTTLIVLCEGVDDINSAPINLDIPLVFYQQQQTRAFVSIQ